VGALQRHQARMQITGCLAAGGTGIMRQDQDKEAETVLWPQAGQVRKLGLQDFSVKNTG